MKTMHASTGKYIIRAQLGLQMVTWGFEVQPKGHTRRYWYCYYLLSLFFVIKNRIAEHTKKRNTNSKLRVTWTSRCDTVSITRSKTQYWMYSLKVRPAALFTCMLYIKQNYAYVCTLCLTHVRIYDCFWSRHYLFRWPGKPLMSIQIFMHDIYKAIMSNFEWRIELWGHTKLEVLLRWSP